MRNRKRDHTRERLMRKLKIVDLALDAARHLRIWHVSDPASKKVVGDWIEGAVWAISKFREIL